MSFQLSKVSHSNWMMQTTVKMFENPKIAIQSFKLFQSFLSIAGTLNPMILFHHQTSKKEWENFSHLVNKYGRFRALWTKSAVHWLVRGVIQASKTNEEHVKVKLDYVVLISQNFLENSPIISISILRYWSSLPNKEMLADLEPIYQLVDRISNR